MDKLVMHISLKYNGREFDKMFQFQAPADREKLLAILKSNPAYLTPDNLINFAPWKVWDILDKQGWTRLNRVGEHIRMVRPVTPRQKLVIALRDHDWTYEYSDDFRVWRRGEAEKHEIQALIPQVPDGKRLYDKYVARVFGKR